MSIGSRIKEARERAGLNQVQLAGMVGITKGAIGNYESDISSPKDDILFKLINTLNIDANFIFQDCIKPKSEDVTQHELKIIRAYRGNPEIQKAVDKLLDIENGGEMLHRCNYPFCEVRNY